MIASELSANVDGVGLVPRASLASPHPFGVFRCIWALRGAAVVSEDKTANIPSHYADRVLSNTEQRSGGSSYHKFNVPNILMV